MKVQVGENGEKKDNQRHCKMGSAFKIQVKNVKKIRILQSDSLFQGYSIQNLYTNAKQCKMYGNLFVEKIRFK